MMVQKLQLLVATTLRTRSEVEANPLWEIREYLQARGGPDWLISRQTLHST